MLEKESEDLREHVRSYKKELDINRQEFENMMRVMEDLETKVNKYQRREESITLLAKDSKQKVEEALLERDKATLKEQQYVSNINKLQGELKTVNSDINQKRNTLIDNIRNKHRIMLQQRDDEICSLEERLHTIEASNERLERENTSLN